MTKKEKQWMKGYIAHKKVAGEPYDALEQFYRGEI